MAFILQPPAPQARGLMPANGTAFTAGAPATGAAGGGAVVPGTGQIFPTGRS